MSAIFFCISWFLASGTPNWILSRVYCLAAWKQNSAAPRAPQAMPYRALLRQPKGPARPETLGSRFSWGTSTSSIRIMPVADALKENLPSILGVEKPFIPRSRMKPRTLPSSHLAQTTAISAAGELVIQVLDPLMVKVPLEGLYLALVSIPLGSLPWLGSVKPKHPKISPRASLGRYLSFCSSVP